MAAFDDVIKAGNAVADVIGAGIIPAGMEMMDKITIHAVEEFLHAGYDLNAAYSIVGKRKRWHNFYLWMHKTGLLVEMRCDWIG